ncbi:MAG: hypothetical protein N2B02_01445, partial [Amylibacter sp.]
NWEAELKRLEGAVTELKPKRKSEKPKSSDKKAKGKTGSTKSPSAVKRGKDFSKKKNHKAKL